MVRNRGLSLFSGLLLLVLSPNPLLSQDEPAQPEAIRWRSVSDDHKINELLVELGEKHRPRALVIVDATLIDVVEGRAIPHMSVVVSDGLIKEVGPADVVAGPKDALVVDGRGKYLLPGLVDSHVHTLVSNSNYLLHLVNGITTVREMCGYPWMLRFRETVRRNQVLAPNLYMTGTIINGLPMGMYAVVARSAVQAREIVREHKRLGYDFIKVHNVLPLDVYQAVLEEAKKSDIDVVGHIPQRVSLQQAISGGQRTMEHFKGYYLDRTLELSSEDYVALTKGADIWNCPTLYTRRIGWRGSDVHSLLASEEARYVPWYERARWKLLADSPAETSYQRVYDLSQKIFKDLLPIQPKFVAGTDSGGGYPMMVSGYALQEELSLMNGLGLSVSDTLRAATINAAQAMRKEKEFGTIESGKRADLLVLSADPLGSVANLSRMEAVIVRGIYLDKVALEEIRSRIAKIYDGGPEEPALPTSIEMDQLAQEAVQLHQRGFVHMTHYLQELEELLTKRERAAKPIADVRKALAEPPAPRP